MRLWRSAVLQGTMLLGLFAFFIFSTGIGCQGKGAEAVSTKTLPQAIHIDNSWIGLSPTTMQQRFELKLSPDQKTYEAVGHLMLSPVATQQPKQYSRFKTTVPAQKIQALMDAVQQEKWVASDKPGEVIQHTDDYPNRNLVVDQGPGQKFRLTSTSNTPNGDPWNMRMDDTLYVSSGNRIGEILKDIFTQLNPPDATWEKIDSPDQ